MQANVGKAGDSIMATGSTAPPKRRSLRCRSLCGTGGVTQRATSFYARLATNVYICLDNLEVAKTLGTESVTTSQETFTQYTQAEKAWKERERCTGIPAGQVIARWVPGHAGILAIEAADRKANLAARQAQTASDNNGPPATQAYTRRQVKQLAKQRFEKYWTEKMPPKYAELEIPLRKSTLE